MGMYPQPNRWQCGPFALKHALLMLGVLADEKQITKVARARRNYGTDETQLKRAAKHFGCDLPSVRRLDAERARREMLQHLRRGIPVLLCVYQWAHWVTVVKFERGKFIVFDSADRAVLVILTWPQLMKRWVFRQPDRDDRQSIHQLYDFHPVVPRFRVRTRPHFSIARVKHLRRPENLVISSRWNEYVADLQDVCKVRTPLSERAISLGEFFRRHESMILEQVEYWHGAVQRRHARKILKDLHFVADTLGMIIAEKEEKRAIAAMAILLTLWAEGESTSTPIYSPDRPRPRTRRRF